MRLIDADALKIVLTSVENEFTKQGDTLREKAVKCAIGLLEDERITPTIDAEPVRHGRWIRLDDTFTSWKCSLCAAKYIGITWQYCPYCGAKMDGGAEG